MFGDPHFATLDGLEYVFNGLGEYWMIKSGMFWLQARTALAWDSRSQVTNATVLGALAAQGQLHKTHFYSKLGSAI